MIATMIVATIIATDEVPGKISHQTDGDLAHGRWTREPKLKASAKLANHARLFVRLVVLDKKLCFTGIRARSDVVLGEENLAVRRFPARKDAKAGEHIGSETGATDRVSRRQRPQKCSTFLVRAQNKAFHTSAEITTPEIFQIAPAAPGIVATQEAMIAEIAEKDGPLSKIEFPVSCDIIEIVDIEIPVIPFLV